MDETTERTFHFTLTKRCRIVNLGNSEQIEFIVDEEQDKSFLRGFYITTKDQVESVARFNAKQRAINLSNFISVKYLHHVRPILEGFSMRNKDGSITVSKFIQHGWLNINELNFDSNDIIVQRILGDTEKNILYDHASRALKAAEEEDPVTTIKELYHVIEANRPIHLNKFEHLRNVLSHKGPLRENTIRSLENGFGKDYFTFTPRGDFDYTSPQNIERLHIQARYLLGEVLVCLH